MHARLAGAARSGIVKVLVREEPSAPKIAIVGIAVKPGMVAAAAAQRVSHRITRNGFFMGISNSLNRG